ncbi:hypothetical protein Poli38472_009343 [Pythium oligandrum]|uniref:Ankyrin repeat protein n=1 Tax=Pythium oligandrum TaxID=41045 RepID=A0A8K1FJQ3_PYTOL|nr:hypothetical protein Poli38472_009343 [Pythium oligandrum]|eukprot:TMW65176.1 hypothetical protein Poli38472_009343 [Pythium oligandrum]
MDANQRRLLFHAAFVGDLEGLAQIFRREAVAPSLTRVNAACREYRTAALAANQSPFKEPDTLVDAWWVDSPLPSVRVSLFKNLLHYDQHHVFAWFFGTEATELIGDTVRALFEFVCDVVVDIPTVRVEVLEAILSSHLHVQVMTSVEQDLIMAKLVQRLLHYSTVDGIDPVVIRLLVAHGCDLTSPTSGDILAFNDWTNGRDPVVLETLLDCGLCPLLSSVWLNVLETTAADAMTTSPEGAVSTLLRQGVDINATNRFGMTALHHAVFWTEFPDLLPLLIRFGADVNAQDNNGMTALDYLIPESPSELKIAMLDILLTYGADPFIVGADGKSAFTSLKATTGGQAYITSRPAFFAR